MTADPISGYDGMAGRRAGRGQNCVICAAPIPPRSAALEHHLAAIAKWPEAFPDSEVFITDKNGH